MLHEPNAVREDQSFVALVEKQFEAAARLLRTLNRNIIDIDEALSSKVRSRPRLALKNGYQDVSVGVGICLPQSGRGHLATNEEAGFELTSEALPWLTIEADLADQKFPARLFLTARLQSQQPLIIDVFVRKVSKSTDIVDLPPRVVNLTQGRLEVCEIEIDELGDGYENARLIMHIRQPSKSIVFSELNLLSVS